ncbi:hypothetical protein Nepgr_001200 [Nepenthes gracilis]|uniref:Uncharacterized protein n=1 Tax=Nepenthes gracilis TaxID=150966 RepID=A0AAD3RX93_NEPGR|nr:hypothetical protein Nepgr_001200 [Nepenthes gracilis]
MGFFVTTLIFAVIGVIASLFTITCCNKGPSTNLFHLTLICTATACCWMMWAIVGVSCFEKSTLSCRIYLQVDSSNSRELQNSSTSKSLDPTENYRLCY